MDIKQDTVELRGRSSLPTSARDVTPGIILAHDGGKTYTVTGNARLFETNNERFLEVTETAVLTNGSEEIDVPRGVYAVVW